MTHKEMVGKLQSFLTKYSLWGIEEKEKLMTNLNAIINVAFKKNMLPTQSSKAYVGLKSIIKEELTKSELEELGKALGIPAGTLEGIINQGYSFYNSTTFNASKVSTALFNWMEGFDDPTGESNGKKGTRFSSSVDINGLLTGIRKTNSIPDKRKERLIAIIVAYQFLWDQRIYDCKTRKYIAYNDVNAMRAVIFGINNEKEKVVSTKQDMPSIGHKKESPASAFLTKYGLNGLSEKMKDNIEQINTGKSHLGILGLWLGNIINVEDIAYIREVCDLGASNISKYDFEREYKEKEKLFRDLEKSSFNSKKFCGAEDFLLSQGNVNALITVFRLIPQIPFETRKNALALLVSYQLKMGKTVYDYQTKKFYTSENTEDIKCILGVSHRTVESNAKRAANDFLQKYGLDGIVDENVSEVLVYLYDASINHIPLGNCYGYLMVQLDSLIDTKALNSLKKELSLSRKYFQETKNLLDLAKRARCKRENKKLKLVGEKNEFLLSRSNMNGFISLFRKAKDIDPETKRNILAMLVCYQQLAGSLVYDCEADKFCERDDTAGIKRILGTSNGKEAKKVVQTQQKQHKTIEQHKNDIATAIVASPKASFDRLIDIIINKLDNNIKYLESFEFILKRYHADTGTSFALSDFLKNNMGNYKAKDRGKLQETLIVESFLNKDNLNLLRFLICQSEEIRGELEKYLIELITYYQELHGQQIIRVRVEAQKERKTSINEGKGKGKAKTVKARTQQEIAESVDSELADLLAHDNTQLLCFKQLIKIIAIDMLDNDRNHLHSFGDIVEKDFGFFVSPIDYTVRGFFAQLQEHGVSHESIEVLGLCYPQMRLHKDNVNILRHLVIHSGTISRELKENILAVITRYQQKYSQEIKSTLILKASEINNTSNDTQSLCFEKLIRDIAVDILENDRNCYQSFRDILEQDFGFTGHRNGYSNNVEGIFAALRELSIKISERNTNFQALGLYYTNKRLHENNVNILRYFVMHSKAISPELKKDILAKITGYQSKYGQEIKSTLTLKAIERNRASIGKHIKDLRTHSSNQSQCFKKLIEIIAVDMLGNDRNHLHRFGEIVEKNFGFLVSPIDYTPKGFFAQLQKHIVHENIAALGLGYGEKRLHKDNVNILRYLVIHSDTISRGLKENILAVIACYQQQYSQEIKSTLKLEDVEINSASKNIKEGKAAESAEKVVQVRTQKERGEVVDGHIARLLTLSFENQSLCFDRLIEIIAKDILDNDHDHFQSFANILRDLSEIDLDYTNHSRDLNGLLNQMSKRYKAFNGCFKKVGVDNGKRLLSKNNVNLLRYLVIHSTTISRELKEDILKIIEFYQDHYQQKIPATLQLKATKINGTRTSDSKGKGKGKEKRIKKNRSEEQGHNKEENQKSEGGMQPSIGETFNNILNETLGDLDEELFRIYGLSSVSGSTADSAETRKQTVRKSLQPMERRFNEGKIDKNGIKQEIIAKAKEFLYADLKEYLKSILMPNGREIDQRIKSTVTAYLKQQPNITLEQLISIAETTQAIIPQGNYYQIVNSNNPFAVLDVIDPDKGEKKEEPYINKQTYDVSNLKALLLSFAKDNAGIKLTKLFNAFEEGIEKLDSISPSVSKKRGASIFEGRTMTFFGGSSSSSSQQQQSNSEPRATSSSTYVP